MTHTYNISGMTCNNCVSKVKSELLKVGEVSDAEIKLSAPQATISMSKHIPIARLQAALGQAGSFSISEAGGGMQEAAPPADTPSWLETYKPILIIGAYITMVTLAIETINGFSWHTWMPHFMAGFFLVFSYFKLLNLKAFAESYAMYDIVAKKWSGWGYVYAFIELALGIAFLVRFNPLLTNAITFIVMSISIIGVLQSVLNKRTIRCACLGAVFNLPMSTITIIEDALMIVMSGVMLIGLL